ncbi:hypothetical protein Tco_0454841 [Tanacetum coccineum]
MGNGQQFNEDDDKITRIERTMVIGDLNRGDVKKTRGGMRTLTKRTKLGTRFSFVRYVNMGDTMDFKKKLRGISISNVKILINIAKNIETKPQVDHSGWKWTFRKQDPKQKTRHSEDGRSFKDAILGTQGAYKKQAEMKEGSNVIEVQANKSHLARLKCCWVGKARNKSEAIARECLDLNKVNLSYWLSELPMWDEKLKSPRRLRWLKIEGLLTLVWDQKTVNIIGGKFGLALEIDDMEFECQYKNSVGVLVLTNSMEEVINFLPLRVNGRIHQIRVFKYHNRSIMLKFPKSWEEKSSVISCDDDFDGISETELDQNREGEESNVIPRESEGTGEFGTSFSHVEISPTKVSTSIEKVAEVTIDYGSHNKDVLIQTLARMENAIDNINQIVTEKPNKEAHLYKDLEQQSNSNENIEKSIMEGFETQIEKESRLIKDVNILDMRRSDDDGFQLRNDSSSSVYADEAKKEIRRKLGIIFDDEPDVNSKDGTRS